MKYLVRDGKSFLEAKLENDKFVPVKEGERVFPQEIFNFGTDIINYSDLKSYSEQMESLGVDYLFVSPNMVNNMQKKFYNGSSLTSKRIITVTAYTQKAY